MRWSVRRKIVWLKACPRCSGDLYESVDIYGNYVECLLCSHILKPSEELHLKRSSTAMAQTPRHAAAAQPIRPFVAAAPLMEQAEWDPAGTVKRR